MLDHSFSNELDNFVNSMLKHDSWQQLAEDVKDNLITRSINDVSAYAANVRCPLTIEDHEFQSAVMEQTVFITEQYLNTENGRTILEENISGFASRRYSEPEDSWICARARAYIDAFNQKNSKEDSTGTKNIPFIRILN